MYDGSGSAGIRYNQSSSDRVQLKIEEETNRDEETNHTTEEINFLAFAGSGFLSALQTDGGKGVAGVSNSPPQITSNGSDATADVFVAKNQTDVTTVQADDADSDALTYSINSGADADQFSIDSSSGQLSFQEKPDFENPMDSDADNIYEVQVQVADKQGSTDTQDISVAVANIVDPVNGTPLPREQPSANTSVESPPFRSEIWQQPWGASPGLAPKDWFWESIPKYDNPDHMAKVESNVDDLESQGKAPVINLQMWRNLFKKAQNSDEPGFKQWVNWIEDRRDYLGVDKNGDLNFGDNGNGYVSPLVPLDPKDYPDGFDGKKAYFADWQADRLARLAAKTDTRGFGFSDFFDSHPYTDVANYFHPGIIDDFEKRTGITLDSDALPEQATQIRSEYYQEWIDYWADRWAYNWETLTKEIREHTGKEPWLVSQTSFTPAIMRRHGGVDARAIMQRVSPDNLTFMEQSIWGFRGGRFEQPASVESVNLALHAAREPRARYAVQLQASDGKDFPNGPFWSAVVEEHWPDLEPELQKELGLKRLKRTWIEAAWTHVATREGDVRRAAEAFLRGGHDKGGGLDLVPMDLIRDIKPARPFGPALYYSVPIERAVEVRAGADSNQSTSSYLGGWGKPVTDIREAGIPFNYYASDAVLENLKDESQQPSAWIIPDKAELLPESEQQVLEETAPVLTAEEAKTYDYPLEFSSAQANRTITGFGFYDQSDRLIVVASDKIQFGESNNNLGSVKAMVNLELPDGEYTARELLTGKETNFSVTSGSGEFKTTINRWDTNVFAITPVKDS
jgi:hypothetical protein